MRKSLFALLFGLCCAPLAQALDVGDPAPAVAVEKWAVGAGKDPSKPDGKSVYVVEFWATWCAPCKSTIPELNKLHAALKGKGVVIMGITTEQEAIVSAFLKDTKMEYNVGLDTAKKTTEAYMQGINAIPHAFVIGKDGKVAWHGNPLGGMDKVLEKILAGTFDVQAEKDKKNKIQECLQEFQAAKQKQQPAAAVAALDKLIALEPDNAKFYLIKVMTLIEAKANKDVPQVFADWEKNCADNSEGLAMLAAMLIDVQDASLRDPQKALTIGKKAMELGKGTSVGALVSMARVYACLGLFDKATELLNNAKTSNPAIGGGLDGLISLYEKMAAARKEAEK